MSNALAGPSQRITLLTCHAIQVWTPFDRRLLCSLAMQAASLVRKAILSMATVCSSSEVSLSISLGVCL